MKLLKKWGATNFNEALDYAAEGGQYGPAARQTREPRRSRSRPNFSRVAYNQCGCYLQPPRGLG